MRKFLFPLLLAGAAFCLPTVARAACPGDTDPLTPPPNGTVCGSVSWLGYNPTTGYYYKPTNYMYVKICPANSLSGCKTTLTYSFTDGYGQNAQAWKFASFRPYGAPSADYDLYAYNYWSTDYWGSPTAPRLRISASGLGNQGIFFTALPRPLPPTPVYPSGFQVPDHYLVRWKSSIDNNDRKLYTATYAIWYKYWPFGEVEPSTWLLSRDNMPCQDNGGGPDSNNECSTYVAGPQPAGNWKWRVVANFGPQYSTTSSEQSFSQPY